MNSIKAESKNFSWRNKRLLFACAVLAVISLVFLFSVFGGGDDDLRITTVKRGDLSQRVTVSGMIEPLKRTVISAPYNGYVQKIYVKVGDQVKVGDPLVTVTQSLQNFDRAYPIRAPFKGTVVQVDRSEGEYVREGTPAESTIMRIDDLSKLFVVSQAPEVDSAKMKVGMEAALRVSAVNDSLFHGVVREMALAAKESDNWRSKQATFDLKVEIMDADHSLLPGMSVIMDVVTNSIENVLHLPLEYVNQEGDTFFVITRKGKRKNIEVGQQTEMAVEIKSGLNEGEEVRQVDFLNVLEGGDE